METSPQAILAVTMRLKTSMGGIKAFKVPGGRIESSYGDVDISHPSGPIEISTSMGEVSVKECRGGTIKSSYGDVSITLASSFSGSIEAETSFGDVDGDVELEFVGKKNKYGPRQRQKAGSIGSGGDRLTVNSSFRDVIIDKRADPRRSGLVSNADSWSGKRPRIRVPHLLLCQSAGICVHQH
ncbi:MAG: DUF4097 domain-containing protein [Desulfobacterales bacterium]|nr:DUF4097 domain-containing protein [Desulfobacterales bacterium]